MTVSGTATRCSSDWRRVESGSPWSVGIAAHGTRSVIAGRSSRSIPVTAPNPCGAGSSSRWRCAGQPCPLRPQSGSWFSMSSGSGQKTPASALLSRTPPRNRGSFAARPVASYSPRVVAEVKALACELPAKLGLPLWRFSRPELRRHVLEAGIVADISGVTIWRWLHEDRTASLETADLDLRGSHPPRAHSLCRWLRCGTGGVTRTRPAVRRRPVTVAGPRACRRDSLGARVADLERSRYGTILSRLAAPALHPFSCRIPAFSVRWMLTACKGKKEGSCVIKSANPEYESYERLVDEIRIVGRAVWV